MLHHQISLKLEIPTYYSCQEQDEMDQGLRMMVLYLLLQQCFPSAPQHW